MPRVHPPSSCHISRSQPVALRTSHDQLLFSRDAVTAAISQIRPSLSASYLSIFIKCFYDGRDRIRSAEAVAKENSRGRSRGQVPKKSKDERHDEYPAIGLTWRRLTVTQKISLNDGQALNVSAISTNATDTRPQLSPPSLASLSPCVSFVGPRPVFTPKPNA